MDHFLEEAVKKRNGVFDGILYYFSLVVMVLSGITALLQISSLWGVFVRGQASFTELLPSLLLALVMAGVTVGVYLTRDRLRTEYEYTFTSGSLDFAQVFNNKKRKNLGTLNVRTVDACGPVDGEAFKRYMNMPEVKQTRWFLNRDGNLHFFYFQKDGSKRMIIFEPTEEMVKTIRLYLPRGVWQE